MSASNNQREFTRHRVRSEVRLVINGRDVHGVLRDLSLGGCSALFVQPIEPAPNTAVTLVLESDAKPVELLMHVVHLQRRASGTLIGFKVDDKHFRLLARVFDQRPSSVPKWLLVGLFAALAVMGFAICR